MHSCIHFVKSTAHVHVVDHRYIAARGDVPKDRLHELSFEQLEDDPLGTLRAIYAQFG
jgi:hypothetical protein